MTDQTPAIEFRDARKVYRDFWLRQRSVALAGLSLKVQPGEVLGILGPNGSGKSTALKLLVGLLRPTQGEVLLLGQNPRKSVARKALGYLPEENANYPQLSGRAMLRLHAALQGVKDASAVAELLDAVDMSDDARKRTSVYSKGMGRRIGLAQCLLGDPQVLVLDEPTTGLDPIGIEMVRDILIERKKRGVTMVVSSHLLAEIQGICDRIVLLSGGELLREGPLEQLLSLPDSTRFEASGISAESGKAALKAAGAKNVSAEPARRTLADLYIDLLKPRQGSQDEEA